MNECGLACRRASRTPSSLTPYTWTTPVWSCTTDAWTSAQMPLPSVSGLPHFLPVSTLHIPLHAHQCCGTDLGSEAWHAVDGIVMLVVPCVCHAAPLEPCNGEKVTEKYSSVQQMLRTMLHCRDGAFRIMAYAGSHLLPSGRIGVCQSCRHFETQAQSPAGGREECLGLQHYAAAGFIAVRGSSSHLQA